MVLEAIFNGEIYPAEQIIPQSDEYKAECKAVSRLMDELKNVLDGEQAVQIWAVNGTSDDEGSLRTPLFAERGLGEQMVLLRLILKMLALPLIAAVTLIQWAGIFLTQFSSVIFNLLAGLMFLLSVVGWLMGICTGAETIRMLAVGFVVFIIPHIAEWLIVRITVINCNLRDFLKS